MGMHGNAWDRSSPFLPPLGFWKFSWLGWPVLQRDAPLDPTTKSTGRTQRIGALGPGEFAHRNPGWNPKPGKMEPPNHPNCWGCPPPGNLLPAMCYNVTFKTAWRCATRDVGCRTLLAYWNHGVFEGEHIRGIGICGYSWWKKHPAKPLDFAHRWFEHVRNIHDICSFRVPMEPTTWTVPSGDVQEKVLGCSCPSMQTKTSCQGSRRTTRAPNPAFHLESSTLFTFLYRFMYICINKYIYI